MVAESPGESIMREMLAGAGIEGWVREHVFAPPRKWRFDFAWPDRRFAVEVEGVRGGHGGRHQRMMGFCGDAEKYEAAMVRGWRVYRVPTLWLSDGTKSRKQEVMGAIRTMLGGHHG